MNVDALVALWVEDEVEFGAGARRTGGGAPRDEAALASPELPGPKSAPAAVGGGERRLFGLSCVSLIVSNVAEALLAVIGVAGNPLGTGARLSSTSPGRGKNRCIPTGN